MEPIFRPWRHWEERAAERSPFVIEGLLHSAATIMSGKAMAGKTTLAAAMVGAVAGDADQFLGRRVIEHGRVMIACTDGGEASAWGERMRHHNPVHEVLISQHSRADQWDAILGEVAQHRPALFVLDNALGSIVGDVRSNEVASKLLTQLDRIIARDVPVLLLHHSSARVYEDNTSARGPMGSTAYDAWDRLTVHVEKTGNSTILVTVEGNDCPPSRLSVDVRFGASREVVHVLNSDEEVTDKRARVAETQADRSAFVRERIVGNPALADAGSQQKVAMALGVPKATVQRALATEKAHFVEGQGWELTG